MASLSVVLLSSARVLVSSVAASNIETTMFRGWVVSSSVDGVGDDSSSLSCTAVWLLAIVHVVPSFVHVPLLLPRARCPVCVPVGGVAFA
eukprot:10482592-Prorocentrum_lima.AAC.1